MGYLENWFIGIGTFVALVVFLYFTFDIARRLLARFALRVCQMRKAPEGGFICELKRKLGGYASQSLVPRVIMLVISFGVLAFIVIEHSPKL
ncbi:hypothetical protein CKO42_19485 [Lamprobacter modestohalophilus]|uniref:Uncharacterized protein n=1 Tax=Lamprobacter modestohalophilus TaxID=1064514 RepID=A0A9X0WBT7_9GAMM|nr:hypothetical protein [Lamprobacter modestohalophilus]MCF7979775.1 hypothetical protein [Chromatiaceae bacterium]MBK1620571.1 hypothetical protein [Lamprobacter modestohalophilus]MCF7996234.1 hypothetical protein [Chromatiaceae bacterium]MCF8004283.1 hypothetical protein [Chromatiaceae bacterium]MCF8014394.1 hypothetical protein [Chromatiaceae bacterium]